MFLDTVGLFATWDVDDQWHAVAEQAFNDLLRRRVRMVSTVPVFHECGNATARKPYRGTAAEFRQKLMAFGNLIQPTEADEAEAWRNFVRGHAGDAGIVDHISFVVMRRLGITEAFTNDKHFRAVGFVTLF